jgi:hypothetical protein
MASENASPNVIPLRRTVRQWFPAWSERHMARHPSEHWPDTGSEFWAGFMGNLVLHGVDESAADEASMRMMADFQVHPAGHLPKLMEHVRAIWKERPRDDAKPTEGLDAARRASVDCEDCQGNGLTLRWRRRSIGDVDSQGHVVGPTITLYCLCPAGRAMEREDAPEIRRRLYDLADHPWLHDDYKTPPTPAELARIEADVPY